MLKFERVPDGFCLSVSIALPGHDELSRDTLCDAAARLEDTAAVIRGFLAGEAMVSDATTGKVLSVPDDVRTSVAGMLRTLGKDSGGDV